MRVSIPVTRFEGYVEPVFFLYTERGRLELPVQPHSKETILVSEFGNDKLVAYLYHELALTLSRFIPVICRYSYDGALIHYMIMDDEAHHLYETSDTEHCLRALSTWLNHYAAICVYHHESNV